MQTDTICTWSVILYVLAGLIYTNIMKPDISRPESVHFEVPDIASARLQLWLLQTWCSLQ